MRARNINVRKSWEHEKETIEKSNVLQEHIAPYFFKATSSFNVDCGDKYVAML